MTTAAGRGLVIALLVWIVGMPAGWSVGSRVALTVVLAVADTIDRCRDPSYEDET